MKHFTNFVSLLFFAAMFFAVNISLLFGQWSYSAAVPNNVASHAGTVPVGTVSTDEPQNYSPDDSHLGELLKQKKDLQQLVNQKHQEVAKEQQNAQAQQTVIDQYLLDSHLKELQPLKPKQTPNGKKAGLDMLNFPEMDGSTSCLNLGTIVASYVLGVPYKWEIAVRQQNSYNNRPPFFRTYPPLPNTGFHNNYDNDSPGTELQVVADTEKTAFRQRNIFRLHYGQFQGTHYAYLSLIGKAKKEDPNNPSDSGNYPQIPGSESYHVQRDEKGKYPVIDPTVTPDDQGRIAFPQSEILLIARRPSEDEKKAMERAEVDLDIRPIALDGFVFVVNRKNPVESLTLEQIQSIYASPQHQSKSWKDFGGNETQGRIQPYERNRNSGSRELMDELVVTPETLQKYRQPPTTGTGTVTVMPQVELSQKTTPDIPVERGDESFRNNRQVSGMSRFGMGMVFNSLLNNQNAIGYSVYHYEHFMLRVLETRVLAVNGVFPNYENIRTKKYPLVYEIYAVTRKGIADDSPAAKLRDWLLSDDGQRAVRECGYVPINPVIAAE
ncbi:MAG: substrate-binding domain-containing protein [Planctomycetaceae bacterium]|jgi:ABC-type phosphate transport system substrate-binding protein|nr:substrate-binding domain-containing protein [Planctomycetaceae bacterium]